MGKKWPKCHFLTSYFFLGWVGLGLWGVRRFHNNIYMFLHPRELVDCEHPILHTIFGYDCDAVPQQPTKNYCRRQGDIHVVNQLTGLRTVLPSHLRISPRSQGVGRGAPAMSPLLRASYRDFSTSGRGVWKYCSRAIISIGRNTCRL